MLKKWGAGVKNFVKQDGRDNGPMDIFDKMVVCRIDLAALKNMGTVKNTYRVNESSRVQSSLLISFITIYYITLIVKIRFLHNSNALNKLFFF